MRFGDVLPCPFPSRLLSCFKSFFLSLVFVPLGPFSARASDGVVEINQTCAVATGCFAGDAEGFPVTIDGSAGHGYRLTSDLTVPDENTSAVVVSTSDVTLDLNGFALLGPVVCDGVPLVCTPAGGLGSGVERAGETHRGIVVKNGSISGMGAFGIVVGEQGMLVGLRVRSNGGGGLSATGASLVDRNTVYANGGDGLFVGTGSTVTGNSAYDNQNGGIVALSGTSVVDNAVYSNGGIGITVSNGNDVRGNVVRLNGTIGIRFTGTHSAYRNNTVTSNVSTPILGSGVNLGGNYCSTAGGSATTCP